MACFVRQSAPKLATDNGHFAQRISTLFRGRCLTTSCETLGLAWRGAVHSSWIDLTRERRAGLFSQIDKQTSPTATQRLRAIAGVRASKPLTALRSLGTLI
jgi:hypothetical protein